MEFIETTGFSRIRENYLNDARFNLLQLYLVGTPDAGAVIRGSGGVRKLRWGLPGHGKRGGLRVIYYWMAKVERILFLTIYLKTEAADLSKEAIREMRRLVKSFDWHGARSGENMTKRDIGAEIIAGLKELRDRPESLKRYQFAPADVKSIREQFEMSQKQFADFLRISVRTLQKWEQGKRNPDGAAHALLRVMEREPDAVLRALHD